MGKSQSKKSLVSKRDSYKITTQSKSVDTDDVQYRMANEGDFQPGGNNSRPNSVVVINVGHQESIDLENEDEDDDDLEENNNQLAPAKGKGKDKAVIC